MIRIANNKADVYEKFIMGINGKHHLNMYELKYAIIFTIVLLFHIDYYLMETGRRFGTKN